MKRLFKFLIPLLLIAILAGLGFWAVKARLISINNWFVGEYLRGVDVSSYQENTDMSKLKYQHIDFAYIKATEGSSHVDETFKQKWEDAKNVGLPAGAYHYFSYYSSGSSQAENFIKTVGDLKGRLIPAVDMELTTEEVYNPPRKEDVVRSLKSFLAIVEEKYRVKPLIYATKDYYDKYLADDFGSYPRWVRSVWYPAFVDQGGDWVLWQYDDKGVLEGYSGEKYIDLDVLNNNTSLDSLTVK